MFCTRCGKQINTGAKFCPFCGQEVGAPVNTAAPGDGVPVNNAVPENGAVGKEAGTVRGTGADAPKKPDGKANFGIKAAIALFAVIAAAAAVILGVKLSGADRQVVDSAEEVQEEKPADGEQEESAETAEDPEQPIVETAEEDEESAEEETEDPEIDEEKILEVLSVYQTYADAHNDGGLAGFMLAYLDEDAIPELIAIGDYEAAGQIIITYHDGELIENYISRRGGLSYAEKQNFYCNSNGHMGYYYDEFYRLEDGKQVVIAAGQHGDIYDEEGNLVWDDEDAIPEQEYSWNETPCSEEEYYEEIENFIRNTVGDAEMIGVDAYQGEMYFNMLDAYNDLKVKTYSASWPEIEEFELKDGELAFSKGGGARYGWGEDDEIIFSVSYPVAENCIWENRSVGSGQAPQPQVGDTEYLDDTTYEEIKEWIESSKAWFEDSVEEYGRDEVWVESPFFVVVVVEEGVVVRVYTVIS